MPRRIALALLVAAFAACARPDPPTPEPTARPFVLYSAPLSATPAAPPLPAVAALGYPWITTAAGGGPLSTRFEAPAGFTRDPVTPRSFGAWLRELPLEPAGTPVRSFSGRVILAPDHESLAAVVALDVGDKDLQQCADSVIRLHAEWLFAQGRTDASYRAASGAAMPFSRWARGERMVPEGLGFSWATSARADATHASYRRWLDAVFNWANTGSLARDGQPVPEADLRAGDFVVQAGAPGHAVLVLDVARAADGRRALLLGQGFMPAQSFHVLRPSRSSAWFVVEPGSAGLDTPFWPTFPWKALRRFAPPAG